MNFDVAKSLPLGPADDHAMQMLHVQRVMLIKRGRKCIEGACDRNRDRSCESTFMCTYRCAQKGYVLRRLRDEVPAAVANR